MTAVVIAHAAVTWFLTGLIWTIQVVHYPLFDGVGRDRFAGYHARHTRRIGWLVAATMPAEAGLAAWIVLAPSPGISPGLAWTGLALVVALWASTALAQVPEHRRLGDGFDAHAHRRLVRGNLLRTVLWTARAVLAAWFLTSG